MHEHVMDICWYLMLACLTVCSIKLGVIEDTSNRTRLAKLLKFYSSNSETEQTSLTDYVERMKEKQEAIYFVAGTSREEVQEVFNLYDLQVFGYRIFRT